MDWFDIMDHDGDDECNNCHDDCYEYDDTDQCHDDCDNNECGCGDDLCCQCHDACGDDDACHDICHDNECAGEDGPPECLNDCANIEMLDSIESAQDLCNWVTGTDLSTCVVDCEPDIQNELEFYDWMCEGCLAEDPNDYDEDGNLVTK